uniref:Ion_trans domain-containing protein n=1 Tax=Schistocephalus solidus TaxID=70667 RepID=A0A0X3NPC6_SCHSO
MVLISLRLVGSVLSLIAGFQWAWIQCLSASVAIIYMLLRIWGSTTFTYAYSMAVIVLVLFAVELLLYCYVSVILGPKVTMIGQMTWEMIAFLPFFLIFLLVFGVTEQAAIFPDRTGFDTSVVLTVLERPFYRLFGENALEDSRGEGTSCTDPATSTGCPQQSIFAVVSIGMYNLLTVILLMNLLIAIFSQIFDSLQRDSIIAWQFKRYAIVRSFHQLSAVPWPLGPFVQFFSFLQIFCRRRLRQRDVQVDQSISRSTAVTPCVDVDDVDENPQLIERRGMFEGYCRDQTVSNFAKAKAKSDAAQFSSINEELVSLAYFSYLLFKTCIKHVMAHERKFRRI